MLTLLIVIAVCCGGILYTQTGLQLGKLSLKAWEEDDNDTTTSFLLFPVSHLNGMVGSSSAPASAFSGEGLADNSTLYKTLMALGWPLKLIWNAASILAYVGPAKIARSLQIVESYEKWLKEARQEKRRLLARTANAEVKLAMLRGLREEIDDEIVDAEAELEVERESRIAALKEAREETEREIIALEAQRGDEDCPYAALLPAAKIRVASDDTDASAEADEIIEIVVRERPGYANLPEALAAAAETDHGTEVDETPRPERRPRGAEGGRYSSVPAAQPVAMCAKAST